MAYLLASELTYQSLTDIGLAMDRDHTTIMHGVKSTRLAMQKDPHLKKAYDDLTEALRPTHEIGA